MFGSLGILSILSAAQKQNAIPLTGMYQGKKRPLIKMAKDPAFLFYDGDASRDVSHMDRLSRGAYFDFMQAQRKFCSPNDGNTVVLPDGLPLDTIKTIFGKDFDSCWSQIRLILVEKNGFYKIGWLDNSITKRTEFCKKQSERVSKRWNNHGNTAVLPCENENEIEDVSGIKDGVKGETKPATPFFPEFAIGTIYEKTLIQYLETRKAILALRGKPEDSPQEIEMGICQRLISIAGNDPEKRKRVLEAAINGKNLTLYDPDKSSFDKKPEEKKTLTAHKVRTFTNAN
jgi:hypothetical protein